MIIHEGERIRAEASLVGSEDAEARRRRDDPETERHEGEAAVGRDVLTRGIHEREARGAALHLDRMEHHAGAAGRVRAGAAEDVLPVSAVEYLQVLVHDGGAERRSERVTDVGRGRVGADRRTGAAAVGHGRSSIDHPRVGRQTGIAGRPPGHPRRPRRPRPPLTRRRSRGSRGRCPLAVLDRRLRRRRPADTSPRRPELGPHHRRQHVGSIRGPGRSCPPVARWRIDRRTDLDRVRRLPSVATLRSPV